ncbi:MAG: extracellular solute-binding protein [Hungatella sp.]|nr:extracellular solute-binding protein [Hungatella sp.]
MGMGLSVVFFAGLLTGCGGKSESASTASETVAAVESQEKSQEESRETETSGQTAEKEAEKVSYWYFHKGDEGEIMERVIERFNASQSEYIVEGFSVPDKQKYIVAMSSDEAPDVIELSNAEIVSYQASGLLENMTAMGTAKGYDFSIYDMPAVDNNSVDGQMYGFPITSVIIQMFYNKDLLVEIGETEPPKTMEELYDMAVRATTLDADGNIDILGYPLFPLASARQELIYAFGGTWTDEDGVTPTADSQGVLDSLNMNVKYRNLYGIDKVQKFVATGNTNRYTPQDIFFAGKQLFRFDGPWLANQIRDNNPDISFDVAMIPGTEANPGLRGVSRYENTSLAIPAGAKEKDGAYAFISWFTTEGAKDFLLEIGSLPANNTLFDDPDLMACNDVFPSFMEALKTGNGVAAPKMADAAQYTSFIEEYLDYVYNGSKAPEKAMDELQKMAESLK